MCHLCGVKLPTWPEIYQHLLREHPAKAEPPEKEIDMPVQDRDYYRGEHPKACTCQACVEKRVGRRSAVTHNREFVVTHEPNCSCDSCNILGRPTETSAQDGEDAPEVLEPTGSAKVAEDAPEILGPTESAQGREYVPDVLEPSESEVPVPNPEDSDPEVHLATAERGGLSGWKVLGVCALFAQFLIGVSLLTPTVSHDFGLMVYKPLYSLNPYTATAFWNWWEQWITGASAVSVLVSGAILIRVLVPRRLWNIWLPVPNGPRGPIAWFGNQYFDQKSRRWRNPARKNKSNRLLYALTLVLFTGLILVVSFAVLD